MQRQPRTEAGRYDAVIAGAGLAGLSLLGHLAATGWRDRRVLLIDDGRFPVAQRAWAYWSSGPGLLDADAGTSSEAGDADAVDASDTGPSRPAGSSWSRLAVHAGDKDLQLPLDSHRYRLLTGAQLIRAVNAQTAGMTGLSVISGQVRAIVDGPDHATVLTNDGAVAARWVFDSVTPADGSPVLALSFLGWWIRCERPAFDPHTVTLFDFRVPQGAGARFVYLLPTSPVEALVELTSLTPVGLPPVTEAEADAALAGYLGRNERTNGYQLLNREAGTLLLGDLPERPSSGRIRPIGLAGGLLKPSTGYAFTRIQRDSAAVAASLREHGDPFHTPPVRSRFRFLDKVFLETIRHDPALLGSAFAAMFAANPPDRILRFLDEESTATEEAQIIASLPPLPFLRALRRLHR